MPDHDYPTPANAFDPGYLQQLDQHDDPVTASEAVTGGFWRVVPLEDERFGLFRLWESPENGDEPFGTLTDRDTALLAAAFLPLVDRTRSFCAAAKTASSVLSDTSSRSSSTQSTSSTSTAGIRPHHSLNVKGSGVA